MADFELAIPTILNNEGGFVNDPNDMLKEEQSPVLRLLEILLSARLQLASFVPHPAPKAT